MMKCASSHFATPVACLATFVLLLSCNVMTVFAAEEVASESPPEENVTSDSRPLYTEETRPDFPVFNSLVGEENFLGITGPDEVTVWSGGETFELEMGQQYNVVINYDNNGLPKGITTRTIANGTLVQLDFPPSIVSEQEITATISATNSQPTSVSSSLTLIAPEAMNLEIVPGSVRIINNNPTNDSIISESDLFGKGAQIGTNSMSGIVLHGAENSGSIVFSFCTVPFTKTASNTLDTSVPNTDTQPSEPKSLGPTILLLMSAILVVTCVIISVVLTVADRNETRIDSGHWRHD